MNTTILQRSDRWFGVPLCFALTIVKVLCRRAVPAHAPPPRNLLIIKLAEQGSTVLAYSALHRATEIVGRENTYFVTFEENRFILDALGVIPEKNVVVVSIASLWSFLRSIFMAIRFLRRLRLDAAIDLEFFSRGSAALAFLSGSKRRIGFHAFFGAGPYRGDLMTHRLLYNPHVHTSQTFLTLVEAVLCIPAMLPAVAREAPRMHTKPSQFSGGPKEVEEVRQLLRRETGGDPPLILLNANCGDFLPLRRWPADRYVALARKLLARFDEVFVVFTGGPNEELATAKLVWQVGSARCISLAGKTSLRQLLVLYTLAEVLVTNDSGPAHFAALTSIRTVTLFGPESPVLFAAQTGRNNVLWARLPCSPCINAYNNRQSPCLNNLCMQAISVDQVFAAVCSAYLEVPMASCEQPSDRVCHA